jgi:hypothetical protein
LREYLDPERNIADFLGTLAEELRNCSPAEDAAKASALRALQLDLRSETALNNYAAALIQTCVTSSRFVSLKLIENMFAEVGALLSDYVTAKSQDCAAAFQCTNNVADMRHDCMTGSGLILACLNEVVPCVREFVAQVAYRFETVHYSEHTTRLVAGSIRNAYQENGPIPARNLKTTIKKNMTAALHRVLPELNATSRACAVRSGSCTTSPAC